MTFLRCLLIILHKDSHEFESSSFSSSHIQKHHAKHHAQTAALCPPVCANSSFNDLLVTANSCSEDLSLYKTPIDVPLPTINNNQHQPTSTSIHQYQQSPACIQIFQTTPTTPHIHLKLQQSNQTTRQTNPPSAPPFIKMHAQNILAFLALAVVAMSAAIPAAVPEPHAGMIPKIDMKPQLAG